MAASTAVNESTRNRASEPVMAAPWCTGRGLPPIADMQGADYPLTTPSGVSRRIGRTREVDAAITASMSL